MRAAAGWLIWLVREFGGDARYRRYLAHHRAQHPLESPMDRKTFYRDEETRKWHGVRRCC